MVFDFVAESHPQWLEGDVGRGDHESTYDWGHESGPDWVHFEFVEKKLPGGFVEGHVHQIAEEDLRQSDFETVKWALEADPGAVACHEMRIVWI